MAEVIHPAVRICVLLVGATAISLGNYLVLAAVCGVVATCYWRCPPTVFKQGMVMLKRMRWFFLSIIVIYLWFTPGQTLFAVSGLSSHFIPTQEGIALGLQRIFILIAIIFMVNLLLQTTNASQLLIAIYWWLRPLKYVGIKPQQVALRISLVLSFVQQGHHLIDEAKQSVLVRHSETLNKTRLLGVAIGEVIHRVEHFAGQKAPEEMSLPEADDPPWEQWLIPCSVLIVVLLLQFPVTAFF